MKKCIKMKSCSKVEKIKNKCEHFLEKLKKDISSLNIKKKSKIEKKIS